MKGVDRKRSKKGGNDAWKERRANMGERLTRKCKGKG
jgi:hypothetical protein